MHWGISQRILLFFILIAGVMAGGLLLIYIRFSTFHAYNFRMYALFSTVTIFLSLAVVYSFVRRSITLRILELRRMLIEYDAQKTGKDIFIKETGNDELTFLAAGINYFIAQVQQREQQLENAAKEARAADEAKSAFVATISHEIRSPMNAIINLTGLCLDAELTAPLDNKRRYWLEIVRSSSEYLLDLTDDLLDSAKVEAGRMELNQEIFRLADLLDKLEPYRINAQIKGLDLQVALENGIPEYWNGDPQRIGQILINLVSNAIKFTESGQIRVAVEMYRNNQEWLLFRVSDTGIGIREDQSENIFRPFHQVGASAQRPGGTGLGLSIAQQLVELMGGSIQAECQLGQGSVFQCVLPLNSVDETKDGTVIMRIPEYGNSIPESLAGGKILLVDDNPFNRLVAEELMKTVGLTVESAEDGVEAVEMVQENKYDLVLMDLNMPRMDGMEAGMTIHDLPDCADLPIIIVTADSDGPTRQRCLQSGMNDIINKPIDPPTLFKALEFWLSDNRSEDEKRLQGQAQTSVQTSPQDQQDGISLVDTPALLQAFVDSHNQTVQRIHQALIQADREEARRHAHNLKSASGAIGAAELNRLAAELEQYFCTSAAVNDDSQIDLIARMEHELQDVLDSISRSHP